MIRAEERWFGSSYLNVFCQNVHLLKEKREIPLEAYIF